MDYNKTIIDKVSKAVVRAGSTFLEDKKNAYIRAINAEDNEQAKWALETIFDNAIIAEKNKSPLCDDTGIPHVVLDIGKDAYFTGKMIELIDEGIAQGLRALPGRPMAIKGDDYHRIDQSMGIEEDSGALLSAPYLIRKIDGDKIKLNVLMFGGGPAIRGKTYRIFHKHSVETFLDEIISWSVDATKMLGCTPCTLAVGVGRSHYEATSMMLQALVDGSYDVQNELERKITERVNMEGVGTLGLGGKTTVLATFMKVGPQRASGVRIVCVRPCCCFEPRICTTEI